MPRTISLKVMDDAQRRLDNNLPSHGDTLRTDMHMLITGTKIFSDAAWKTKKAPGMGDAARTGIGVYCQIQEANYSATVLIQASTPQAPSVIQAEAEALLLAARIASILQLQEATFLTNNATLARAAAAPSASHPWEIRRHIADYNNLVQSSNTAVYHIKREINGVSHNCAHQAIRQNVYTPIFSCSNSAHRNISCPLFSAVQQMQSQVHVIHDVNCV
jgi:hypothetical protein